MELDVANTLPAGFSTWASAADDPCTNSWAYVACTSGVVTGLDLSSLSLVGVLPASLRWVDTLQSLSLASNSFSGSLPRSWSTLTALTLLRADSNSLSASIPDAWSTMGSLLQLNLGYNSLTGTLPPALPSGMTSLTRLIATDNADMCGPYPGSWTSTLVASSGTLLGNTCAQTSGLIALKNAVTVATWPSLSGWTVSTDPCSASWTGVTCSGTKVTGLDLSFYNMVGSLPTDMSKVTGLQTLSLGSNL